MESGATWSVADATLTYHKLRPPFIWQKGDTHLSFAQVKEAMKHVCLKKTACTDTEWPSLILELDRRYFLSEKLRWEFSSRDHFGDGLVSLEAAKQVAMRVNGCEGGGGDDGGGGRGDKRFPTKAWKSFVEGRTFPKSLVAYEEIEVFLCNLFNEQWEEEEDIAADLREKTEDPVNPYRGYDSDDDIEDDLKAIDLKFAMFEAMEKRRAEAEKELHLSSALKEKERKAAEEKEARGKAEAEEKRKKEEIAKVEQEEEDRLKAEERARRKAEKKAELKAKEQAKKLAEVEEKARLEAEERARLEAEEKNRLEAEEKNRLEAQEKTKSEAEEKARLEAEEKARLEAEEKARLEAEEKAKQEAEELLKLEEIARLEKEEQDRKKAEEKAKRKSEKKAKLKAEKKAKLEAAEKARLEGEEKARLEAEEKARLDAEEKARLEAEEKARLDAEEKARLEGEEKARLDAEEKARLEGEEKARLEAEEKARLEGEEKARQEAEEKARMEAEEKAKLEAEEKARQEAEAKVLTPKQKQDMAIRQRLKTSLLKKEKKDLETAIGDFKKNKLEDTDGDLMKAERLIKTINTKMELGQAVDKRLLAELERLMEVVKTEKISSGEIGEELLTRASTLLTQLRKLERAQKEILDLKQSTIAEIRGYQNPPPPVHQIMMATLLLIGHREKELKNWQTVQATLGKTGKDGIKRRILACKPEFVSREAATRSQELLRGFDLVEIKDVSLGAGTFFVWANNMIESCLTDV